MEEEPNFEALAKLWLARDPRAANMPPEAQAQIVARLADALKKRRQKTDHKNQEVGLVVNIDRDNIIPGKGLAEEAIEQLTQFLRERIESEHPMDENDENSDKSQ